MLFSIGFVTLFIIGGLSGVTHSIVPADYQQTDTYYIVAHFHYVLFAGAVFGLFSGIYYWWPKITGKALSERIGKLHFWLMFIGTNLTFGPMHILGLQGMSRRYYTYPAGQGFEFWNFVETIGAFIIALSIAVFLFNAVRTARKGKPAGNDPWDARTLEWSISSPPPHYNFAEIPTVHERDEWWHRKYTEDPAGKPVPVVAGAQNGDDDHAEGAEGESAVHDEQAEPHMPRPSYWPLVAAAALPMFGYGLLFQWALIPVGLVTLLVGIYGWALEPVE
jgi:cytochrome c oxidase subunit 1